MQNHYSQQPLFSGKFDSMSLMIDVNAKSLAKLDIVGIINMDLLQQEALGNI
ncbi:hypothetical protein KFK09_022253 [Dendrobium nobile]|uniref:Uncharacterized protein n=1 Tax=Dendrobium nobile TaxID=94219 RepID=A0A8T3AHC7_DENNO|nr:hypothetical protein KFK09_022253 [Dendrobium nobile]